MLTNAVLASLARHWKVLALPLDPIWSVLAAEEEENRPASENLAFSVSMYILITIPHSLSASVLDDDSLRCTGVGVADCHIRYSGLSEYSRLAAKIASAWVGGCCSLHLKAIVVSEKTKRWVVSNKSRSMPGPWRL